MKNMLENTYTLENGITEHKTYEQAMAGMDETLKKMELYYQDFCCVFAF